MAIPDRHRLAMPFDDALAADELLVSADRDRNGNKAPTNETEYGVGEAPPVRLGVAIETALVGLRGADRSATADA